MLTILRIDAAWTQSGSSGVALISGEPDRMFLVACDSSYSAFLQRAGLNDVGFSARQLLKAARLLSGCSVDIVAIDLPMSLQPFLSRREADDAISRAFGRHKAGTHSPSSTRPGEFGMLITSTFHDCGYSLAVCESDSRSPALIEVYPHVSLIALMHCSQRRKYKVHNSHKFWKGQEVSARVGLLMAEWNEILKALSSQIENVDLRLPEQFLSLASMKPYEDKLDAIVCAWTGLQFHQGRASPFGDRVTAAIWVPV